MSDPHIVNLYEAYSLPFKDLQEIVEIALTQGFPDALEKLDGQNLTIYVNDSGEVRFIGKGCPKATVDVKGLSIKETKEKYKDNSKVAEMFAKSMEVFQKLVDSDPIPFINVCNPPSGMKCINAEVLFQHSRNVIHYEGNYICIHGLVDSNDNLDQIKNVLPQTVDGWVIQMTPRAKFTRANVEAVATINSLLNHLRHELGLGPNCAVGNICLCLLERALSIYHPYLGPLISKAAMRLLFEDASFLKKSEFKTIEGWNKFKQLDDDRVNFVGKSLVQLDVIIQLLGSYAIESCEFEIPRDESRAQINRDFVTRVRKAMKSSSVRGSPVVLSRIANTLARLREENYTREVEGIVFQWKGSKLKLTGAFANMNRLLGYFNYGYDPARLIDGR